MYSHPDRQGGQTTVELALCLPVLALVLGFVVEVGLVVGDQVRLWHAAREAARVAVVDDDRQAALEAPERTGLRDIEMTVDPASSFRVQGRPLTVDLEYSPPGRIPLVGWLTTRVRLRASAAMRIEEP